MLTAGPEFRPFEPHLPLRGMLTYDAEEARFTECLTGRDYPLVRDGDYAALEHAYLAAGAEPGGPIMASFDGAHPAAVRGTRARTGGRRCSSSASSGSGRARPASGPRATASLTNTYWKILRLGETELSAGEGRREPNLILRQDEPRFTATVGCNQLTGGYTPRRRRAGLRPGGGDA